ncbi:MAG: DNA-directed RNA polymerase subunit omega [Candidatus Hydrogenedentes bacterium]|nr:DNA-directed RNA polymerase subunit omega [Candidatus Hydrogenedentota bacterium]
MPTPFSVDEFSGKIDSLYRLVIVAARRANQLKVESHGFSGVQFRVKPTVLALEEVLDDKLGYATGDSEEEEYLEISD